jgi:hypothetical protein
MNNFLPKETPKMKDESGTNVKRFLSTRGLLIMKEFKDINVVKCHYGKKINISTAIISTMASPTIRNKVEYGVRFELIAEDEREAGMAFLDFDELDELISALDFVNSLAQQMINQLFKS